MYIDPAWGRIEGREAIREFFVKSMAGLTGHGWSTPENWTMAEGHRLVSQWDQILGRKPDGTAWRVPGLSILYYAGDGLFCYSHDMLNMTHIGQTMRAMGWKPPAGFNMPPREPEPRRLASRRLGAPRASIRDLTRACISATGMRSCMPCRLRRVVSPSQPGSLATSGAGCVRIVVAGLSLAAYAIPVSIAYASLAGLPPESGLYCYLLGGVAYALFGSSRQLAIGPTSAIAMLVGATLGPFAEGDPVHYAAYAAYTALFVAAIAALAWLFRLGGVVQFVSETVLSGFKIGAALVIASTQLPKLFGVTAGGANFFERIANLIGQLGAIHLPSLLLGVGALCVLILGDRFLRGRPVVLIVVVASILLMTFTGLAERGVAIVGELPRGLPALGVARGHFEEIRTLLPLALACFLLAFVEGISTARTFGLTHGYAVDTERELLATAAANLAAGLGQGFPVAGGMSQSAVNDKAGARTPAALLVASGAIALVLIYLTGVFRMLPQPVLAAVVLVAVAGMIDVKALRHLRRVSRFDFYVALVAAARRARLRDPGRRAARVGLLARHAGAPRGESADGGARPPSRQRPVRRSGAQSRERAHTRRPDLPAPGGPALLQRRERARVAARRAARAKSGRSISSFSTSPQRWWTSGARACWAACANSSHPRASSSSWRRRAATCAACSRARGSTPCS